MSFRNLVRKYIIPLSVHSKLNEFVSVKDFGAKGDGRVVDGRAIQKAINSIRSGGVVFFPAGEYKIKSALKIQLPDSRSVFLIGEALGVRFNNSVGVELYLMNHSHDNMIECVGAGDRGSIGIDNIKLYGNKSKQNRGHGLVLDNLKDIFIGNLIIESIKGDGVFASRGPVNQLFANYIEVQSSGRHGFNGGSLADSHLNYLITGGNEGHGVQLGSHVQINQIHSYLNGKSGLSIIGKQNQIGLVRANHNKENGVLLSNADNNTIDSLLAYNNGYVTKEEKKSDSWNVETSDGHNAVPDEKKSGLSITGASRGNIIQTVEAIDDQVKENGDEVTPNPTQCYGVYLKDKGGENRVDRLVAHGNANRPVFFHSNTIGRGDVVAQPQRQTLDYAAALKPNPNLGELVIVNTLTGNIMVEEPEPRDCNEGQRLTFEFTQDSIGGREISFSEEKFVASWIPNKTAYAKNYITFTYINGRWIQTGNLPEPVDENETP